MQQLAHRLPRRRWRAKKSARLWFREHRRFLRYAGIFLLVIVALIEIVQLAYPTNRTLPFVRAGGYRVGSQNVTGVTNALDAQYADASLIVKADKRQFTRSISALGGTMQTVDAAHRAADYPWWQRLIPLSSVAIMVGRDTSVFANYTATQLQTFAQTIEKEAYVAPTDAALTAKRGKMKLVPAVPGKEYKPDAVVATLKAAPVRSGVGVQLDFSPKAATISDTEVKAVLPKAQQIIDHKLSLLQGDKKVVVDKTEFGSWLTVNKSAESQLQLDIQSAKLKTYLEKHIQPDIYQAPGTTYIQLIDDREVERKPGKPGRGVAMDAMFKAIETAIHEDRNHEIAVALADIPPIESFDKKYSNTDTGLAQLLSGIAATKGGYGISLMELNGRSAYANGTKQFVAASTYKLYVAYAVIKEVEAGRMSWSDTVSGGRTVAQCFDAMIVVSDNACPQAFGRLIGWSRITTLVQSVGISKSTRLGATMYTTPNDLAYFLYRVQNSSLISGSNRTRLIDAMKRQSYTRAGIPAGAGGAVADKVGDVDGYLHDAAIVYGSKKTYVLVVMTSGSSWSGIADAARQVQAYVNK